MRKSRHYTSIHDCPILIFQSIMETGNLDALVIRGKPKHSRLIQAWDKIMNEYIQAFGLPELYIKHIELREKASKHYANAYLKGRKHEKVFAKIAEAQALEVSSKDKASFAKTLAYASKQMGFRVDPKTTTVFEFYSYLADE